VADGDDLAPLPDSDGEGAGAMAQNGVGAVVERLKGWNDSAPTDQTRGVESSSADSSLGSWVLELCLGKEIAGACQVLEKILIIESTESSSFGKNSFGNTIGVPKTASARERPVSSLGCAWSPRSTKGSSLDHVAATALARSASLRRRCSLSTEPFNSE
jgi:hypothetical protein